MAQLCGSVRTGFAESTVSHHANAPENTSLIDTALASLLHVGAIANPLFGNGFIGNLYFKATPSTLPSVDP